MGRSPRDSYLRQPSQHCVRDTGSGRVVVYDGNTHQISFGSHKAPTLILRRHHDHYELKKTCQAALRGLRVGAGRGASRDKRSEEDCGALAIVLDVGQAPHAEVDESPPELTAQAWKAR